MRLVSSETFQTGVRNLVYAPDDSGRAGGYDEAKAHLPQPEE